MDDVIDFGARITTGREIFDVARDQAEAAAGCFGSGDRLVDVALVPALEIVEPDDMLSELDERFGDVRADETGGAGNQPTTRIVAEVGPHGFITTHERSL